MARKDDVYEEDDGRTIADMSEVSRQSVLFPRRKFKGQEEPSAASQKGPEQEKMSREDRRVWVLAALKSSLLIGLVYLLGLGAIIALMLMIWS